MTKIVDNQKKLKELFIELFSDSYVFWIFFRQGITVPYCIVLAYV